jgi:hypothetical protein
MNTAGRSPIQCLIFSLLYHSCIELISLAVRINSEIILS